MQRVPRSIVREEGGPARVTSLELFFDLVFVFALTQVTALIARDPTFASMGRGLLVLAILWWAWSGYAWLTSTVDPELALTRVVMFAAMGAMLIVALATPRAFGDDGVVWGVAYLALRLLHAALFRLGARGDPALRHQVVSLVLSVIPGAGLIILAGAALEGTARDLLWVAAVLLDYGIVLSFGVEGWRVRAEHFAERFALIVIIALGESIVAIGVGAQDLRLDALEIAAALTALAVVCLLWWGYFDVSALIAEHRFREATGADQLRLARDAYALLHLPMVAGIALFAVGVKKTLGDPGDALKDMPAVALCAGLALYAVAHVAFRLRSIGALSVPWTLAALGCLALLPIAMTAASLVALALLAVVWLALIAYETLRQAAFRHEVRAERVG